MARTIAIYDASQHIDEYLLGDGVAFPATAVPSSDPNTFDDYEEGSWTVGFTFSTPGDLVATVSYEEGHYIRLAGLVYAFFDLDLSTFTHSLASGAGKLTGLPFASAEWAHGLSFGMSGWNRADVSWISPRVNDSSQIQFYLSRDNAARDFIDTADMPSGGTPDWRGAVLYKAA